RVADGDPTLLEPMAAELVGHKVDLIMALGPASVRAARAATTNIPIVAGDLESDPLSTGFIAANRRPGGEVAGGVFDFSGFSKKWLQALKEAVPQNSTVAVLWDSTTGRHQLQAVEAAAVELNLKACSIGGAETRGSRARTAIGNSPRCRRIGSSVFSAYRRK